MTKGWWWSGTGKPKIRWYLSVSTSVMEYHALNNEVILVSRCSFPTSFSCRAGLPSAHTQTHQPSQTQPDSLLCFGLHLEKNDLSHGSCLGLGCLALQSFRIVSSVGREGNVVVGRMLTPRRRLHGLPCFVSDILEQKGSGNDCPRNAA